METVGAATGSLQSILSNVHDTIQPLIGHEDALGDENVRKIALGAAQRLVKALERPEEVALRQAFQVWIYVQVLQ